MSNQDNAKPMSILAIAGNALDIMRSRCQVEVMRSRCQVKIMRSRCQVKIMRNRCQAQFNTSQHNSVQHNNSIQHNLTQFKQI